MNAFVIHSAPLTSGLSRACGAPSAPGRLARCGRRATRTMTMTAGRKFMVGGNWKCNLDTAGVKALVDALNAGAALDESSVEVVVSPPLPYLGATRSQLRADFAMGAQNAWTGPGGAFTGETDATMLTDVGCQWLIVGHSERRHTPELKESDATCATKARRALDVGLKVIFCIGELLSEREAGDTLAVCERQLGALAPLLTPSDWASIVIAYEPVWAIGTGKVATPEQADEVHRGLRAWLSSNVSREVGDSTRILYGGSVSAKNCTSLAELPDIDGFLVGGASLKPDFLQIIDSYKAALAATV